MRPPHRVQRESFYFEMFGSSSSHSEQEGTRRKQEVCCFNSKINSCCKETSVQVHNVTAVYNHSLQYFYIIA